MNNDTINEEYDVAIIGGGPGGLVTAIELARAGMVVVLFEKKTYPYHKVCGEYVSNEVLPYLQSVGFDPFEWGAVPIVKLRITAAKGKELNAPLPLGGFGISRYTMDAALAALAANKGVSVRIATRIADVVQTNDGIFTVTDEKGRQYRTPIVVGSWGKRDMLDKKLDRSFMHQHTGFMGVKYHIRGQYPVDEISLHLFPGGYCGLTKVDKDVYNLCYLYQRTKHDTFKSIEELEKQALYHNPTLRKILEGAEFVRKQPEVINEISFKKKDLVEDGVLMCGDAAGLITPLCGNGMAMAIRSAKILSDCILNTQEDLNTTYTRMWNAAFKSRLAWGRVLQRLFYNPVLAGTSLSVLQRVPALQTLLIRKTHGTILV